MNKIVRFGGRRHAAMPGEEQAFIVRPRWTLVFQDAEVHDPVTPEPRERVANAARLAASLGRQVGKSSWRVMHRLRRAS